MRLPLKRRFDHCRRNKNAAEPDLLPGKREKMAAKVAKVDLLSVTALGRQSHSSSPILSDETARQSLYPSSELCTTGET